MNLGDLTWNKEEELCARKRLGKVDVLAVSPGPQPEKHAAEVDDMPPRIAILGMTPTMGDIFDLRHSRN